MLRIPRSTSCFLLAMMFLAVFHGPHPFDGRVPVFVFFDHVDADVLQFSVELLV